jgi:hypothetical protein
MLSTSQHHGVSFLPINGLHESVIYSHVVPLTLNSYYSAPLVREVDVLQFIGIGDAERNERV